MMVTYDLKGTVVNNLLENLIDRYGDENGCKILRVSIYDTAWILMIIKGIDGKSEWLFPKTFQFICHSQTSDGGWHSDLNVTDAILNTLTCLLSLKHHQSMESL